MYPADTYVSIPGGTAVLSCLSQSPITTVEWIRNGTALNRSRHVQIQLDQETSQLNITNIPLSFNNSWIQCRAMFSTGMQSLTSNRVLLLLQGQLLVGTSPALPNTVI